MLGPASVSSRLGEGVLVGVRVCGELAWGGLGERIGCERVVEWW